MKPKRSLLDILNMPVSQAFDLLYHGMSAERIAAFATADSTHRLNISPNQLALPDQHYVTVTAQKTVLAYDRVLLKKFYPVAHSTIVLLDGEGTPRSFTSFETLDTNLLGIDSKAGGKLVQGPRTLLDSVPFRGGSLDATIALLGVEAVNYATPLLSTLKCLSDIGGVSFFASATAIAEPLVLGIQSLSKAGGGVQIAYTGNLAPQTGVFLIADIARAGFDWTQYGFASDYTLLHKGTPVTGQSYMVITLEVSTKRAIVLQIPELRAAAAALDAAVSSAKRDILLAGSDGRKRVENALANLQWACLSTLELCSADGRRIAQESADKIATYLQLTSVGLEGHRGGGGTRTTTPAVVNYEDLRFSLADLPAVQLLSDA